MRNCASNKAMGVDKLKNEFIKNGGDDMIDSLVELMTIAWHQEFY